MSTTSGMTDVILIKNNNKVVKKKIILYYKMQLHNAITSKPVTIYDVSFSNHVSYYDAKTLLYNGSIAIETLYNEPAIIAFIKDNVTIEDIFKYNKEQHEL